MDSGGNLRYIVTTMYEAEYALCQDVELLPAQVVQGADFKLLYIMTHARPIISMNRQP